MNTYRKNVGLWTLYDFANSIATITFFLYFSQWLVVDHGVSDFWYNMIFTVGSLLLLITAPVLGSIADKTGKQQRYLNQITLLTFACFVGASLGALFLSRQVIVAALFYLLANYLYQFSFVFYNAILDRIAPPEKRGWISGIGQAGNWLGQITGLVITLPLASGAVYLFGEAGRAQTFLPASILFFILALPMLLFLKLPEQERLAEHPSIMTQYQTQWRQFRELIKVPSMGAYLLAYFFFNDAIITAANNFPIYMRNVFAVSDKQQSLLLIGVLVTSVIGALVSGWAADKIGLKKCLIIVLGSWVVLFPLLALAPSFEVIVILAVLMGFFFGSIWTVTRAAMTALCPREKMNFGFSLYTLAERVSTFVGPVVWGLITSLLGNLGSARYRLAATAMAVFVAIGLWILRQVEIGQKKVV